MRNVFHSGEHMDLSDGERFLNFALNTKKSTTFYAGHQSFDPERQIPCNSNLHCLISNGTLYAIRHWKQLDHSGYKSKIIRFGSSYISFYSIPPESFDLFIAPTVSSWIVRSWKVCVRVYRPQIRSFNFLGLYLHNKSRVSSTVFQTLCSCEEPKKHVEITHQIREYSLSFFSIRCV